MIFSIGNDISNINRIAESAKNPRFLEKNFSQKEREYFSGAKNPAEHIAGAFCAKEAFAKSLGTGFRGFSLADIEVLHDEAGAPYLKLSDKLKTICDGLGISAFYVSISHDGDYATAVVVAEK